MRSTYPKINLSLVIESDFVVHIFCRDVEINKIGDYKIPKHVSKVRLATIVEGDPKAPFSIATTPRCRGGRYSIPRIAPLYP